MEFKLKAPIAKLGKDEKRIQLSLFKSKKNRQRKALKYEKLNELKELNAKENNIILLQ